MRQKLALNQLQGVEGIKDSSEQTEKHTGDIEVKQSRSRYANKVAVVTDEDRKKVLDLVANVALMDKLVTISAF